MNDEVLYTVSSAQKFFEITGNQEFHELAMMDIAELHPPLAKYLMGVGLIRLKLALG